MKAAILLAAGLGLGLAMNANAQGGPQSPAAGAQPPAAGAPAQAEGAQTVRSVKIVDLSEFPEAVRSQVDAAAQKASKEQMDDLRASIDGSPEIKQALEEKGLKSADVVIANLDPQGVLTLVTKKAG